MQAAGGTAITASARPRGGLVPLALGVAVAGFVADLATKTLALATLDPLDPPRLLGGLLTLQLIRNPGAAFSMGENFTLVLSLIAIAAFVFVAGRLIPRVRHRGWAVAEGLLLAGISGNLVDRLFREPGPLRGHVVDFLQLPHFAIFNVADMCITGAAALIVWLVLLGKVGPDGAPLDDGPARDAAAGSVAGPAPVQRPDAGPAPVQRSDAGPDGTL